MLDDKDDDAPDLDTGEILPGKTEDETILPETRTYLRGMSIALGIRKIEMSYAGSGDSGGVEDVQATGRDGVPVFADWEKAPTTGMPDEGFPGNWTSMPGSALGEVLGDFLFSFVEIEHDGFWDGEGGVGTVVWDVMKDEILVHHGDYVTEVEYTTSSY